MTSDRKWRWKTGNLRAVAVRIAERLFTGGMRQGLASRLELKYAEPDGKEKGGGGWCIEAATDQIIDELKKGTP